MTTYNLDYHPEGGENPPPYGFRLDVLAGYLGLSALNQYTFDVNNVGGTVGNNGLQLVHDTVAGTMHITGYIIGGYDNDGNNPSTRDFEEEWYLDFIYSNITSVLGDDDFWTIPAAGVGAGTLRREANGDIFGLDSKDKTTNPMFSFRFGDKNDDLGHRDVLGMSGWG
jgi:hypothetical protein